MDGVVKLLIDNRFVSFLLCSVVKKISQLVLIVTLLSSALVVHAGNIFGEIGLHIGGDDVRTPVTDDVMAGGLFSASVGLLSPVGDSLDLRASIGIKYGTEMFFFNPFDLDPEFLNFKRYPLGAMLITNNAEGINYGVGMTYHLKPEMSSPDNLISNIEFDDAFGFVAEIDIKLGKSGYVGIKYTSINYKTDNPNIGELASDGSFISVDTVDGNSIGLVIGMSF